MRRNHLPGALARALVGALAGGVATVVMSAYMVSPPATRLIGTPPPHRIANKMLPHRTSQDRLLAAAVIHLAVGAGGGAAFSLATPNRKMLPLVGAVFGLVVWAIGYEVAVPALGVLPVAHHDDRGRLGALVRAHLLYGTTLGVVTGWLDRLLTR